MVSRTGCWEWSASCWEDGSEVTRGCVGQQSLILLFPRRSWPWEMSFLLRQTLEEGWEVPPGEGEAQTSHSSLGAAGLPVPRWTLPSLAVLAQGQALAHSVTSTRPFRGR